MRSRLTQEAASRKSDFERGELNKDKTGVRLEGIDAVNPANGKEVPMFVSRLRADGLRHGHRHGRAAAMTSVTGTSRRKFGVCQSSRLSRAATLTKEAFTLKDDTGIMVNSGFLNGMTVKEAIPAMRAVRRRAGLGPRKGQLQATRLGILPPALLGRADPDDLLPEVRLGARARRSAAAGAAAGRKLRADRRRRKPHFQDDRLGQHDVPVLRRPGQARDRYHAAVGRFFVVLPAVYGPARRQGTRLA